MSMHHHTLRLYVAQRNQSSRQLVKQHPQSAINVLTFYLLASVLSALDPVAPGNSVDAARAEFRQSDMMSLMAKKLAISTEWKDPELKATILLKWTLFLTDARHRISRACPCA